MNQFSGYVTGVVLFLFITSCQVLKGPGSTTGTLSSADMVYSGTIPLPVLDTDSAILCYTQGIHYSGKTNSIYMLYSDPDMGKRSSYYTAQLDKSRKNISAIQPAEIKSRNGQSIHTIDEYTALLEKGRKAKYNIPFFKGIAYDEKNNTVILLNAGSRWMYNDTEYTAPPSLFSLSEDDRLMGQFAISRIFRSSTTDTQPSETHFNVLAISPSNDKLFTATSLPLPQDMPDLNTYDTGFVRIVRYRTAARSEEAQFLYPLHFPNDENVIGRSDADHELIDILPLSDSVLWILEGLKLADSSWEYKLYEVVLYHDLHTTSKKTVPEIRKRPILEKKQIHQFSKALPQGRLFLKDMCWGPVIDKERSILLLTGSHCSSAQTSDIHVLRLSRTPQ